MTTATPEAPDALDGPQRPAGLAKLSRSERAELRAYFLDLERQRRARARAGRVTDTEDMTAAAIRQVRAIGRRAGAGNVEDLAELAKVGQAVDDALVVAVRACAAGDDSPYSWGDVGRALGMPRQNAHRKYAPKGDA